MKKSGAYLVVKGLEEVGVRFTFGIPGVHNTEIYDNLNSSEKITPVLVTSEMGASFIADGMSRTSDTIGTLVIVPAAGMTHALSGIGEAYLGGIPMLIVSGGIRRDTGREFQLHQVDQMQILKGITKKSFLIEKHSDIIPTIYEAYRIATSGNPGPVFIEVPVNIQLFEGDVDSIPKFNPQSIESKTKPEGVNIENALKLIQSSKKVGIFVGWGCRDCTQSLILLAEKLNSPVAVTLQGLSVFPSDHPLHVGMGFGNYSVPAGEEAFKNVDCLLAIGTKFAEIPTGSFGMKVPENLIHIDIDPNVFSKNYPAKIAIESDAGLAIQKILSGLDQLESKDFANPEDIAKSIQIKKQEYSNEWMNHKNQDRVNPYSFFQSLRKMMDREDIMVVDDGNHTFLAAELFPVRSSKSFISPTDYNAMGYCVPASIGAKFANPNKNVVGIVGDGAFLMTGMELVTAATWGIGVIIVVFNDGELAQISQGQEIPYSRKTCTKMGVVNLEGIAIATGSKFISIQNNDELDAKLGEAFSHSKNNQPVIVDLNVDYSKKTRFTQGIVKTNLGRFPFKEKVRFIGRAVYRKIVK